MTVSFARFAKYLAPAILLQTRSRVSITGDVIAYFRRKRGFIGVLKCRCSRYIAYVVYVRSNTNWNVTHPRLAGMLRWWNLNFYVIIYFNDIFLLHSMMNQLSSSCSFTTILQKSCHAEWAKKNFVFCLFHSRLTCTKNTETGQFGFREISHYTALLRTELTAQVSRLQHKQDEKFFLIRPMHIIYKWDKYWPAKKFSLRKRLSIRRFCGYNFIRNAHFIIMMYFACSFYVKKQNTYEVNI